MRYSVCLMALFLLFSACGGGKKRDKKEVAAPAKTESVGTVHFFLETSASMGGYLKGGTTFKDVVADVVTKANQIRPTSLYTISGKAPQPVTGGVNSFVAQLATTPLATGKSSEMHQIFKQVGSKATGNDLAIFVSDCILSFPDADIKSNPEVNRSDASSTLKNNIYDQFASFSKQGIGATVLAYTSPFNGTYYTYQNQKQKLAGEQRPFYIWVIGKQKLVGPFVQQLIDGLTTPPIKRLDFGAAGALNRYDLFFALNKKGDWRADHNNVTNIRMGRKAQPVEFAIGLNMSGLPDYAQAEAYLKSNLAATADNGAVKLVSVQRKDAVKTDRMSDREQKLLSQNTHVLTFRVDNLFADAAMLTLKLPVRFDTWYTTWSTMDDRTEAGRKNKTFALEHLMTGVREAYQTGGNEFANLTIQLKK
ncbi:hypothetical protein J2I47_00470 [Fibrella sp. HMF5335]|uniref:VWFA domain-containing protein n=1 Tax=Fibrella rubiginis TaxID=2817060 RepID=A0A939G9M6_9BACT|nr:hypothetical protein [Fibrella rubiginis]MBO0935007.1 hypothetical protein [Fibrella rubiginis]